MSHSAAPGPGPPGSTSSNDPSRKRPGGLPLPMVPVESTLTVTVPPTPHETPTRRCCLAGCQRSKSTAQIPEAFCAPIRGGVQHLSGQRQAAHDNNARSQRPLDRTGQDGGEHGSLGCARDVRDGAASRGWSDHRRRRCWGSSNRSPFAISRWAPSNGDTGSGSVPPRSRVTARLSCGLSAIVPPPMRPLFAWQLTHPRSSPRCAPNSLANCLSTTCPTRTRGRAMTSSTGAWN